MLKKNYKILSFHEIHPKKIDNPIRLSKQIRNMKFKLGKHYNKFISDETDEIKRKEYEDYQKYQLMLNYRRKHLIELTKLLFEKKPPPKRQTTPRIERKERNIYNYYLVLKKSNLVKKYKPYLFPIRANSLRKRYLTDINMTPKKNLKKSNLINSKKIKVKNNKEDENNIKRGIIKMHDRQTIVRIKKNKDGTYVKSNNVGKKEINTVYLDYLCNKRSKMRQTCSSIEKKIKNKSDKNSFDIKKQINELKAKNERIIKTKKINFFNKVNNNKTGYITPFFQIKKSKSYWFVNKSPKKLSEYDDADIKKRLELSRNNDKFLPVLYYNFDSTLKHSAQIIRNVKRWNKELRRSVNKTQKQKKKINRIFFKKVETPSMRDSLKLFKQKKIKKKIYDFLTEHKGKIKLKIRINSRKGKETLSFVEDYNKSRNQKKIFGKRSRSVQINIGYRSNNMKKLRTNILN